MTNIGKLFVQLFLVISLSIFRSFFATIVSLFGAGAVPFLTAPAPAPAPSKPFRRLRLRLRLRPKCVGSGGSGSGSGSGSASLLLIYSWIQRLRFASEIWIQHYAFFRTVQPHVYLYSLQRHGINYCYEHETVTLSRRAM